MSDNPNDSEVIRLGIETDEASFDVWDQKVAGLTQSFIDLGNASNQMSGVIKQSMDGIDGYFNRVIQDSDNFSKALEEANQRLLALDATRQEMIANAQNGPGLAGGGGGTEGGAEGGGDEGGGDAGGGSIGSVFGIAHGVRAASGLGRLAGLGPEATNAFTGGADVLYLVQGFKQLNQILPTLNGLITATPGALEPVVAGFTAMGIPLAGLAAVAVPLVAIIATVVIGLKLFNDGLEESQKHLESALSTQKEYYAAVAAMTTAEAEKHLKDLQDKATTDQQARDESQRALDSAKSQLGVKDKPVTDLASLLDATSILQQALNKGAEALGGKGLSALQTQLDADQKQLDDTNSAIGRFTGGLASGAFAANDHQKAIDDLTKEYKKADEERVKSFEEALAKLKKADEDAARHTIQVMDDRTKLTAEAEKLGRDGTVKSVQDKIQANEDVIASNTEEIDALKKLDDGTGLYAAKITDLKAKNDLLIDQNDLLINQELALAKARELQEKAAKDIAASVKEQVSEAGKTSADIDKIAGLKSNYDDQTAKIAEQRFIADSRADTDFALKRSQAKADFDAKQAQEEEDHARDRANKVAKYTADISDIEAKAQAKRIDDINTFNEENAQKAVEFNRKIQQINSDSHNTILEAASRLDARAIRQEENKRDKQVQQATQSYEDEKAKRQQSLSQKLADLDQNTKAEEDKRITAFNTELKDYDDQYATKRQREQDAFTKQQQREDQAHQQADQRRQEDYARQDRERTNAFTKQVNDIISHNAHLSSLQNASQAAILDSASGFWSQMKTLAAQAADYAHANTPLNNTSTTPFENRAVQSVAAAQAAGNTNRFSQQTVAGHGFAGGTPNTGPASGLIPVDPGEIVGNSFVGDVARNFLGNNFTQPQLASAIAAGAGGGSNGGMTWSGDVNINGPIGQVNPNDLRNAMKAAAGEAMQETFKEYTQKTWRH